MEIMQDAISTHIYTIHIFLAIMLFNLYSVISSKDFISLAKRLKFMTPVYHLSNAIVMIPASIFLLVIEIKRYKKQRVIKVGDMKLQEDFYAYAKKIYLIEISVLVLVYVISKVF